MRAAPGDQSELIPGPLPELDPQAIADMELFAFDALVVECDLAAGQNAVDVGQHQLDGLATLFEFHAQSRGGVTGNGKGGIGGDPGYLAITGGGASWIFVAIVPVSAASGNRPTTSV